MGVRARRRSRSRSRAATAGPSACRPGTSSAGRSGARLRARHGRPAADRLPRLRLHDPDARAPPAVRRRASTGRSRGELLALATYFVARGGLGLPVVRAQPGLHRAAASAAATSGGSRCRGSGASRSTTTSGIAPLDRPRRAGAVVGRQRGAAASRSCGCSPGWPSSSRSTVLLAPLYHRWYRHMRRAGADDRARRRRTYPPPGARRGLVRRRRRTCIRWRKGARSEAMAVAAGAAGGAAALWAYYNGQAPKPQGVRADVHRHARAGHPDGADVRRRPEHGVDAGAAGGAREARREGDLLHDRRIRAPAARAAARGCGRRACDRQPHLSPRLDAVAHRRDDSPRAADDHRGDRGRRRRDGARCRAGG